MSPCNDDDGEIDENSNSGNMPPTTTPAATTATITTSTAAAAAATTSTAEEDTTHTQADSNEAAIPLVDDGGITSGNNELPSTMSASVPENTTADDPAKSVLSRSFART